MATMTALMLPTIILGVLVYASYKVSESWMSCDKKDTEERKKWCRVGKWGVTGLVGLILLGPLLRSVAEELGPGLKQDWNRGLF